MKCQKCNEENATIHLTEIEKGEKKEIHLCETCYKEKNLLGSKPPSIDNLIKNFMDEFEENLEEDEHIVCPVCGTSYAEFQKTGLFGCPEDYSVFREEIDVLLEKIHGAVRHTGKVPKTVLRDRTNSDRIIMLRKELDEVIRNEMYERAAKLRDEIHQLEEKEGHLL
jgi:protein arginine kinase activator